jgi:hypothetical protein
MPARRHYDFTAEETAFLKIHGRYGPVVLVSSAAEILGCTNDDAEKTVRAAGIGVYRWPGRRYLSYVCSIPLAKAVICQGIQLPEFSNPEPWQFSRDDRRWSDVLVLGRRLTSREFRALSLEQLTYLRMHARYGPILTSTKVAHLLNYSTSTQLTEAVRAGRVPLRLVIPTGRHKSFASTRMVAAYLSVLGQTHELPCATKAGEVDSVTQHFAHLRAGTWRADTFDEVEVTSGKPP